MMLKSWETADGAGTGRLKRRRRVGGRGRTDVPSSVLTASLPTYTVVSWRGDRAHQLSRSLMACVDGLEQKMSLSLPSAHAGRKRREAKASLPQLAACVLVLVHTHTHGGGTTSICGNRSKLNESAAACSSKQTWDWALRLLLLISFVFPPVLHLHSTPREIHRSKP